MVQRSQRTWPGAHVRKRPRRESSPHIPDPVLVNRDTALSLYNEAHLPWLAGAPGQNQGQPRSPLPCEMKCIRGRRGSPLLHPVSAHTLWDLKTIGVGRASFQVHTLSLLTRVTRAQEKGWGDF